MSTQPLSPELTEGVIAHLNVASAVPTPTHLDQLIAAYICLVPWESAFRIAKRARTKGTAVASHFNLDENTVHLALEQLYG